MTHSENVKKAWSNSKKILNTLNCYTFEETRAKLIEKDLYKKYQGKAKNRAMLRDRPELYKSIYQHTENLEKVFKEQKSYKTNYNFTHRIKFIVELNGDVEELRCECGRTCNWTKYCRKCPEPKKNQLGRPHTQETRRKMRISTLKYLEQLKGQLAPRYNKDSITLIEQYGKQHGYNFIHAENGGEYFIKELGYFLDAYDPFNNVALEVDEKHHFDVQGNLLDKDKQRQKEIQDILKCKFIRIKYDRV